MLRRLHGLEKRLVRDSNLKTHYTQFLIEYEALGHVKRMSDADNDEQDSFYLPHYCVFKNAANSSKIRVVFNASCKSSTGISLNDALLRVQ